MAITDDDQAARLLGVSWLGLREPDRQWLVEHRWMMCATCGRFYPWSITARRRYWPSSLYATCWPCHVADRQRRAKLEPRWWRWLAARVRIRWSR